MPRPKEDQVAIAEQLQLLWLKEMRKRMQAGEITSTDLATLARVLEHNGWTLNPADLPQDLREQLTAKVDPDADLEEDRRLRIHG